MLMPTLLYDQGQPAAERAAFPECPSSAHGFRNSQSKLSEAELVDCPRCSWRIRAQAAIGVSYKPDYASATDAIGGDRGSSAGYPAGSHSQLRSGAIRSNRHSNINQATENQFE